MVFPQKVYLKFQAQFPGSVREGLDPPVIKESSPVKYDLRNSFVQELLGDQLPDFLGCICLF